MIYGNFQRLQVPNIDDPDLPSAPLKGQMELFPSLLERYRVYPFVIPRAAYIKSLVSEKPDRRILMDLPT